MDRKFNSWDNFMFIKVNLFPRGKGLWLKIGTHFIEVFFCKISMTTPISTFHHAFNNRIYWHRALPLSLGAVNCLSRPKYLSKELLGLCTFPFGDFKFRIFMQ